MSDIRYNPGPLKAVDYGSQYQIESDTHVFGLIYSKEAAEFFASAPDLLKELDELQEKNNELQKKLDAPDIVYGMEVLPTARNPKSRTDHASVDVIIDLDGNRDSFIIGYFDYEYQIWCDDRGQQLKTEGMHWMEIPFRKNEKEN